MDADALCLPPRRQPGETLAGRLSEHARGCAEPRSAASGLTCFVILRHRGLTAENVSHGRPIAQTNPRTHGTPRTETDRSWGGSTRLSRRAPPGRPLGRTSCARASRGASSTPERGCSKLPPWSYPDQVTRGLADRGQALLDKGLSRERPLSGATPGGSSTYTSHHPESHLIRGSRRVQLSLRESSTPGSLGCSLGAMAHEVGIYIPLTAPPRGRQLWIEHVKSPDEGVQWRAACTYCDEDSDVRIAPNGWLMELERGFDIAGSRVWAAREHHGSITCPTGDNRNMKTPGDSFI